MTEQDAYNELLAYTLTHGNVAFIHQHAVDCGKAATAKPDDKPIGIAFSLAGLYLYLELGWTGRQVQQAHRDLAKTKQVWPPCVLPEQRGNITVFDVIKAEPGEARDAALDNWCASLWSAYSPGNRDAIIDLLKRNKIIA